MNIKFDKYEIDGKLGCYTVITYGDVAVKTKDKKFTGETKWAEIKRVYYGNLNQCFRYILKMGLTTNDLKDVKEVEKLILDYTKMVKEELQKLGLR